MKIIIRSLALLLAITATVTATPVSAAAIILMQQYNSNRRADEIKRQEAQKIQAVAEARKNIYLEVSIASGSQTSSSRGPVASGSQLRIRATYDLEYISSEHREGAVLSEQNLHKVTLGDEFVLVPKQTSDGQVLVEISATRVVPSSYTPQAWSERSFASGTAHYTMLLESGGSDVTKTFSIPGSTVEYAVTIRALVPRDTL